MIVDERMVSFINSLDAGNPSYLNELEEYARETDVPIVRTEMQSFLRFLMKMKRPVRILEVGTAIGFSALLMSEYAPKGCKITTIEKYEKRIPLAIENFKKAGKEEDITLLQGDALEILPTLQEEYDFIFMDAAKGQYTDYYLPVKKLVKTGGVLMSDNVLFKGMVANESIVQKNKRGIVNDLMDFNKMLSEDKDFDTSFIPMGDGVAISIKK